MDRGKLLLLTLGLVCTGCPNPNLFTTPRTVPPGEVQHTVTVETIGISTSGGDLFLPTVPSYTARIGLADRMELGVHLSHLSSLGADFKWNPVRTDSFDLAIDPGAQIFYFFADGGFAVYYLRLPLVLGFNVSKEVSLVLTPGIEMVGIGDAITDQDDNRYGASDSTLLARAGFGVDIRASEKFSVQPEATILKSFEGGGGIVYLAGVGFKFGAQPQY